MKAAEEEEELFPESKDGETPEIIYQFEQTEVTQEMVESQLAELAAQAAHGSASFSDITPRFKDWI